MTTAPSRISPHRGVRPPAPIPSPYRRRRIAAAVFALCTVLALVALAAWGGRASADTSRSAAPARPLAVYTVHEGDTLWSIALRLAPNRDPRKTVHELEKVAGGDALRPGQKFVLPPSLQPR